MLKPGKIRCMLEISSTNVGTEPMTELDREMTPILAELITLGSENKEHPTTKELFNWLVAPNRTGKEFYYVVGPLQEYVFKVMTEHFEQYVDPMPMGCAGIPGKHLGKVAAEALAVICPVLEGSWERVAWVLLSESTKSSPEDYGFASDRLTAWLVHVIGDPDLCPNPYLRIELIHMFTWLAELDTDRHKSLLPKAFESILSACAFLNIEYLQECKSQYGYYHKMHIIDITMALNDITMDIDQEYDDIFAEKLQKVKFLRISAQVHDVAYCYAVKSNKFEEPILLQGLTAILKTINSYVQLSYIDYQKKSSDLFELYTGINCISNCLQEFMNVFTKSCRTPHLIGLTASCILSIMEIAMSEFAFNECRESLSNISMMLIDLFDENLFDTEKDIESPDNIAVMDRYKERLNYLKINYC